MLAHLVGNVTFAVIAMVTGRPFLESREFWNLPT
jgi:hypothetical protein